MKKNFLSVCLLLLSTVIYCQAPQSFSYQAVAHNGSGGIIANKALSVKASILDNTMKSVYSELQQVTTNQFGLFTCNIGSPTNVLSGIFAGINWQNSGKMFMKIEVDTTGAATNYILMGTTQLQSVPFALSSGNGNFSKTGNDIYNTNSGNVGIGTGNPTNKLQVTGNLLVNQELVKTNTAPTASQIKTMVNGSTTSFVTTDSVGKIYDPGGSNANYLPNLTATTTIVSGGNIGIEISIDSMDLGTFDSLFIKDASNNILLAVGNNYHTTGVYSFSTNTINIVFKSNADAFVGAGFVINFKKLYDNASTPVLTNNVGNSLFFDTKTGAFRAGNIESNKIGGASTAIGYRTIASGGASTAIGDQNQATADDATAFGYKTIASGKYSTAMGYNTTASELYSTAMGKGSQASGIYSTAIGNSIASNTYSTAMGGSTATGIGATAMGNSRASNNNSTALGSATASGAFSTAMGQYTTASGDYSTTMGARSEASGDYSTAMGYKTNASAVYSTAMGDSTNAIGWVSTTMGYRTTANFDVSTAMGYQTTASAFNSTAMGYQTTASGSSSTALGFQTTASNFNSTAMGQNTTASGQSSTAMGYQTTASGFNSIAGGNNTTASGNGSFTTGYLTTASGNNSTAIGYQTTASGFSSIAMGINASTNGYDGSFCLGGVNSGNIPSVANDANSQMMMFFNSYKFWTSTNGTGVSLPWGGNAWITICDKRKKENFLPLNGEDILMKISPMQFTSWNYKHTDALKDRHYGIMAQDFYSAFGKDAMGTIGNDTTVNPIDMIGIDMAAIQALEKRTSMLQSENNKLVTENNVQQQEINALKTMLLKMENRLKSVESRLPSKKNNPLELTSN